MKKYTPHILITLLAAAIILLLVTDRNSKKDKINETITLRRKSKLPYGTWVAFNGMDSLFPRAKVSVNYEAPDNWDESADAGGRGHALIVISNKFDANEYEMNALLRFAKNGNDIFISAVQFSSEVDQAFGFVSSTYQGFFKDPQKLDDRFRCTLNALPFSKPLKYYYPGRTFGAYFSEIDESTTYVLGRDYEGRPNFIHLKAGEGNIFIQLEPLAFSNYFLLHRNNIAYFEQSMSLLRPGLTKIIWDEYFINKKDSLFNQQKRDGWFRVLMRYPAFRAALLTAFLALLVFVLMEMRRKQRMIPVIRKPRNESLDFVKTIGRLYYDKGDHRNLGKKMSAYFLEHVRNKYKLSTSTLDAEFTRSLHFKSGVPLQDLEELVTGIREMDSATAIGADKLAKLHRKLEAFYQKS